MTHLSLDIGPCAPPLAAATRSLGAIVTPAARLDAPPLGERSLPCLPRQTDYDDPFRFTSEAEWQALIRESLSHGVSDLFFQAGRPVSARLHGQMWALSRRPLDPVELEHLLQWSIGRDNAIARMLGGEAQSSSYEVFDLTQRQARGDRVRHRYRVHASPILYRGSTCAQIVMRAIPHHPPRSTDIGLTDTLLRGATPPHGIVYIAGATGSGKTTSFAALIRHILEGDTPIKGNLITYEEPIEFVFDGIDSSHSIISQSEVPRHCASFADGIREAMRRKPELIMIGEARDEATISAAVEASLTGHPVYTTVHAVNVATVVRRLISRFPRDLQHSALFDILETVRFIMAQRLVPSRAGPMLAVREYLEFTEPIRHQLLGLGDMAKVTSQIGQWVRSHGQSFGEAADQLLANGTIDARAHRDLTH